jgi:hypothetical protein
MPGINVFNGVRVGYGVRVCVSVIVGETVAVGVEEAVAVGVGSRKGTESHASEPANSAAKTHTIPFLLITFLQRIVREDIRRFPQRRIVPYGSSSKKL